MGFLNNFTWRIITEDVWSYFAFNHGNLDAIVNDISNLISEVN